MPAQFTGRHMLLVMLGFFGTVIGANLALAYFASATFGGTVVDNSYVASQHFNDWLQAGRAQAALQWTTRIERDVDDHLLLSLADPGGAIEGAEVRAVLHHPLGERHDTAVAFTPLGGGRYRTQAVVAQGRWQLKGVISRGDTRYRLLLDTP